MSYGYTYTFPAIRGIQAGREYYVIMCPLSVLPKIFLFDELSLPPELRAQRTLNTARIPEIVRYIVDNRHDYAFSAITASIDGQVRFEPADMSDGTSDVGKVIIPMSARFVINDGQHRRAAIERALEEQPDLKDENIAVVFYLDEGLQRSQQLFADLNKHAVRPTKSIGILYDYRDPLALLSRELANRVPVFKGLTEMEKTSISNRSIKLFTVSGIYQATSALLEKRKDDLLTEEEKALAIHFWSELGKVIPEWQMVVDRKVSSAEVRRDYVHAHSVALHALGLAGADLTRTYSEDWPARLSALRDVDWSRNNKTVWEGRAMIGGQMSKVQRNVQLTANYLKHVLGLPLSAKEAKLEQKHEGGAVSNRSN